MMVVACRCTSNTTEHDSEANRHSRLYKLHMVCGICLILLDALSKLISKLTYAFQYHYLIL